MKDKRRRIDRRGGHVGYGSLRYTKGRPRSAVAVEEIFLEGYERGGVAEG